jgi:hypothetical protein
LREELPMLADVGQQVQFDRRPLNQNETTKNLLRNLAHTSFSSNDNSPIWNFY